MPFNGSGIFQLPVTTVTPAASSTTIDSADFNTFTADLETALTLCVTNDGQTVNPRLNSPYLNEAVAMSSTSSELNILDGATVTVAEINSVDGSNAATATTVATGDRVVYNDNGTMIQVDVDDIDTYYSQTTKTLTNKRFAALYDTNGNELIKATATASAVNEITVVNSATGNDVVISATGDDTNIDLDLQSKGAGSVLINGASIGAFKGCLVYEATTGTNIGNGAWVAISFDTDDYDTDAFHDVSTNKTRITIPNGSGITKVRLSGRVATNPDVDMKVRITKKGATYIGMPEITFDEPISSLGDGIQIHSPVITVVNDGTDYFELEAYGGSGASNVTETGGVTCWFALEVIA